MLPFYVLFTLLFTIVAWKGLAAEVADLATVLQRAAGVYKMPPTGKAIHPDMEKTVIVTASNRGYLNHLMNLKCFMDRLNFKFITIAMDEEAHNYLVKRNDTIVFPKFDGIFGRTAAGAANFRSKEFNIISFRKVEIVLEIMQRGYNVLFIDNDVALVADPFPYMLWRNIDYVFSVNIFCWDYYGFDIHSYEEGNTGFYFIRSSNASIRMYERALQEFQGHINSRLDDQTLFWKLLKVTTSPPVLPLKNCSNYDGERRAISEGGVTQDYLVICPLDACEFSSGGLWGYDAFKAAVIKRNQTYVALHANWLTGNGGKKDAMKIRGFWLLDDDHVADDVVPSKCKEFIPPF
eukprot:gene33364-40360_t